MIACFLSVISVILKGHWLVVLYEYVLPGPICTLPGTVCILASVKEDQSSYSWVCRELERCGRIISEINYTSMSNLLFFRAQIKPNLNLRILVKLKCFTVKIHLSIWILSLFFPLLFFPVIPLSSVKPIFKLHSKRIWCSALQVSDYLWIYANHSLIFQILQAWETFQFNLKSRFLKETKIPHLVSISPLVPALCHVAEQWEGYRHPIVLLSLLCLSWGEVPVWWNCIIIW